MIATSHHIVLCTQSLMAKFLIFTIREKREEITRIRTELREKGKIFLNRA